MIGTCTFIYVPGREEGESAITWPDVEEVGEVVDLVEEVGMGEGCCFGCS